MPRRGAFLYALLVFLAGASLIREAAFGRLAPSDEKWSALIARIASPRTPAPQVTLVEVNEDTMTKHAWPWGPDDFALFFHAILPFEPAVLALGEILDFDRSILVDKDPVYEKILREHVLRSPKLVLGGRLGWSSDSEVSPDLQPMPVLRKVKGDLSRVPEFTDVESWASDDYRLSTQPGWLNLPGATGPQERCPLVLRYRGQPVPGIVLQLAMHFAKVTIDEVDVVLGSHVSLGKVRTVPIDERGRMTVHLGARFGRVAFDDLLLNREQVERKETPGQPVELFKGCIIMLARTDAESRTVNLPGGRTMTPGEFFATSLATLQTGAHPRRVGSWFDWSLVSVVAFCALWLRKWKPLLAVCIVVALLLAYAGAAFWAFRSGFLVLPIAMPAGLGLWVLLLRAVARRIEKVIAF